MKKSLVFFFLPLFFFLAHTSFGQSPLSIGVKGGVSISRLSLDYSDPNLDVDVGNIRTAGFVGGGLLNYSINEMFSVQTELLYLKQGGGYKLNGEYNTPFGLVQDDARYTLALHYLHVPVLAKVSYELSHIKLFATLGPYAGFWLSGKERYKGSITYFGFSQSVDERSSYDFTETDNRVEFGLAGGIGVSYDIGPGNVFVEGRYNLGLTNIIEISDGETIKNRTWTFSLGYLFPLGK